MKKRLFLITAIVISFVFIAAGCGNNSGSDLPQENEAASAETAVLGNANRFAGVVTSSGETKIEKDDSKTIAEVKVSAGDEVKKDQVLFTYDGDQAQLTYDKASLELEQLKLTLQSYNDQKAALENEKAYADQSEQLSYTLQIQEADTNIRETTYNITVKEKEVEKAEKGLKDLEVRSPIDGIVQSVNSDSSLDSSGSLLPFIVLMNTGTYRVKAYINELNAHDLYEGVNVTILSRTDDSTWTGKVASIDFENPSSSQQEMYGDGSSDVSTTSKYPFYVTLDNADGLILGQHVFVEPDIEIPLNTDESVASEDTAVNNGIPEISDDPEADKMSGADEVPEADITPEAEITPGMGD